MLVYHNYGEKMIQQPAGVPLSRSRVVSKINVASESLKVIIYFTNYHSSQVMCAEMIQ